MTGREIRTILFDIDGTILDTEEFVLRSFEFAFTAKGYVAPTRDVIRPHIGRPLEAIYADFALGGDADELTRTHRWFQTQNLRLSQPYPGARETLEALRAAGIRMAAVTSRSRLTSTTTLELAGVLEFFGAIVSAEDVTALKPDPEPMLAALAGLGLTPADAIAAAVVGDTHNDIGAGKAVGAFTVAATYGFHGEDVLEAAPDAVIRDIAELPGILGV